MDIVNIVIIAAVAFCIGIGGTLALQAVILDSDFKINMSTLFSGIIGMGIGLVIGLTAI